VSFAEAIDEAKRAAASSAVREIVAPIEKALYILSNYTLSTRVVAEALGIDRSRLRRALASAKAGRELGKVGRPLALTKNEENDLVTWCKEQWASKDSVSCAQLLEKVRSLHARFLLFFARLAC
jgi:hypothetical protein